ncbi:MAG: endo alpha-1,4 polygalactosaminidase [Actinomycetales bacterium]
MKRAFQIAVLAVLIGGLAHPHAQAAERWVPVTSDQLHLQLAGKFHLPRWATVVEIDGADSSQERVRALQQSGRRVVCYLSAGSIESFRDDVSELPDVIVGEPLANWPDERWLDVRRTDVLVPWITKRVQGCARKGFDGVEFDNMDAYENQTGFAITQEDQLHYANLLATIAHAHGLAAGLKNAPKLASALATNFDWAIVEQCVEYVFCESYRPFLHLGKPVFIIEYRKQQAKACRIAASIGAQLQVKRVSLDAWTRPCPSGP